MILGIGIDLVEIERFKDWHKKPIKQLERIFHPDEIAYCLSQPVKSAERFAARFAAREALFKAFSSANPGSPIPFLTLCAQSRVLVGSQGIQLVVNNPTLAQLNILISLTHSRTTAGAVVIIQRKAQ